MRSAGWADHLGVLKLADGTAFVRGVQGVFQPCWTGALLVLAAAGLVHLACATAFEARKIVIFIILLMVHLFAVIVGLLLINYLLGVVAVRWVKTDVPVRRVGVIDHFVGVHEDLLLLVSTHYHVILHECAVLIWDCVWHVFILLAPLMLAHFGNFIELTSGLIIILLLPRPVFLSMASLDLNPKQWMVLLREETTHVDGLLIVLDLVGL